MPTKTTKKAAKKRVTRRPIKRKSVPSIKSVKKPPDNPPVLLIAVNGELGPFGSPNAIGEEWTVARSDWTTISFLQSLDEVLAYTGDSLIFVHLSNLREAAQRKLEKVFPNDYHSRSIWAEKNTIDQALNGCYP